MCMTSAVFDQWRPAFPPAYHPVYPWVPALPGEGRYTIRELRELLEGFDVSLKAAKKFDEITGQPDCEDPEKAHLLQRIAEIERTLDELVGWKRRTS